MVSPLTVDTRAMKAQARPRSTRLKDVAAAREEGERLRRVGPSAVALSGTAKATEKRPNCRVVFYFPSALA